MPVDLLNRPDISTLLCRVVEKKLNASGALDLVKKAGFGNNPLELSAQNSLLLEFQGPSVDSRFRMLVSFLQVNLLSLEVQAQIARCRDLLWLDLVIFWTPQVFDTLENQSLKNIGVHVLTALPPKKVGAPFQQIPDFIHVPDLPYGELLEINLLANEIVKRLRKKFHLVLSELAADTYDDYGTYATREVMRFEDGLLRETLVDLLGECKGSLAIDVGCGNGRHSRTLAKYFAEVVAFDLSRKMIDAAREKDRKILADSDTLVNYYECDVEYEEFPGEDSLAGKADFICASFGMPSFVEDTAAMLRRFYKWLRPNGKAFLTFYNSRSVALAVNTPWKERALSASIDLARHALDVVLRKGVRFSIYCKPLDDGIMDMVAAYFTVEQVLTFPHVLALLPPAVFGTDEEPQDAARDVFSLIDRVVAEKTELDRGHYVFVVACKKDAPREGFLRILSVLQRFGVEYEVLEHREVVSTKEVSELLSLTSASMVKTVIFKSLTNGRYLVALVPPNQRVDLAKLATAAGLAEKELILAPPDDVEREFGLPIGGISPLGFEKYAHVQVFVDPVLRKQDEKFMFMGVGDNTKTLKLPIQDFLRLTADYDKVPLTL